MPTTVRSVLGLDVGHKRIGVAVATLSARLPRPLITLSRDDTFFSALTNIIETEGAAMLVVGFPRGLQGQTTEQTEVTAAFADQLRQHFDLPVHFTDEAVTSITAEAELKSHGKAYAPEDIDALAATYILEDFLAANQELVP